MCVHARDNGRKRHGGGKNLNIFRLYYTGRGEDLAADKVKLSARQQAFVEAYVTDIKHNQTAAAIAAGYKEKTAAQAGSRLMKNEKVAAAIAARIEELHEQNTANANEVVEFLSSVMRGEEVDNWVLRAVDGSEELQKGEPSAKDRLKAAEMLSKYYALFTEAVKADDDGKSGVIIIPDTVSDEEVMPSG